jgi:hypothetical protein
VAKEPVMKGLCEYVLEAGTAWSSGIWTGGESAAYADYVEATIHEDQTAEESQNLARNCASGTGLPKR